VKTARFGRILERIGAGVLRYSLVFFLLFFGALKWTVDEARGVNPLIANSPFLSWANHLFGVQGASEFIGIIELAIALLIALRFWKPLLSAWGSVFAVGMFLVTLSFLFTTPNVQQSVPFLLKDLSLLGASLWTAGEAFGAVSRGGASA
jgi:reactive chlorine resistance protein C